MKTYKIAKQEETELKEENKKLLIEISRLKDCIKDNTKYLKEILYTGEITSLTYLNLVIEDNELYL